MPIALTRNTRPLLRTVKRESHATPDDHVDRQLPTPPGTNSTRASMQTSHGLSDNDINRSPESSGDEAVVSKRNPGDAIFKTPRLVHGAADESRRLSHFRVPTLNSPTSAGSKRDNESASPKSDGDESDDEDAALFGRRRAKKQKQSTFSNIHVVARKAKTYGNKASRTPQKSSKGAGFKQPRKVDAGEQEKKPQMPQFRKAIGFDADMFEFGSDHARPQFRLSASAEGKPKDGPQRNNSLSPLLSSPNSLRDSPDGQEISGSILPAGQSSVRNSECPICNESVDPALHEQFQDLYTQGANIIHYKWQQRFCRWHKQHHAEGVRVEQGYPDVDWAGLDRRIRKYHRHLRDVISGKKESVYRQKLSAMVREGSKTAMEAIAPGTTTRDSSVGYYGPRGERVMTEHIVSNLSDDLRRQSSKDKLVAAGGISGGVSGFVQSVLVPELVEQLIMEDMRVSIERAREILVESAELGELLHPDANDRVADIPGE